jgi:hypothetical protein
MMFKYFAQPLTGTANIALANIAFAHTACPLGGHALAALETTVALHSNIASFFHACKGTFILTKIKALSSSYWSL